MRLRNTNYCFLVAYPNYIINEACFGGTAVSFKIQVS